MRIIAGTARGRRISAPSGRGTRPTSDRVREALFSALADHVPGAVVLDLFAGSGALGLEAVSRAAEHAVLVDDDPRAVKLLRANAAAVDLADRVTVVQADAARFCRAPRPGGPYHLVLADPPYEEPLGSVYDLVADLEAAGALAPLATVVVERSRRDPDLELAPPGFLAFDRARTYGDTVLLQLHRASAAPAADPPRPPPDPPPTAQESRP